MGALWWWIWATSAAEIIETVAEVEVVIDPAVVERMSAERPDLEEVALDALPPGALTDLREQRTAQRQDPAYGVLTGRLPVFLRVSESSGEQPEFLSEIVSLEWGLGVPAGRRRRIICRRLDGRSQRIVNWPIEPTFDIRDPQLAGLEIPQAEFERSWYAAGSVDQPRSVEDLLDGIKQERHYRFVFFWGHAPRREHQVDASCFSQWYPAGFTFDGLDYPTAEHWMMAGKARLFGDEAALAKVLAGRHPGQAKSAGREVRGFNLDVWQRHRSELVLDGTVYKFAAHPDLRDYLLGTGDRVLVEASPADSVWGIGLAANDDRATDPAKWVGSNLLGFALMAAREHLMAMTTA